jgi:restriction system protein
MPGEAAVMWEYAEAGRIMTLKSIAVSECIYCRTPLHRLPVRQAENGSRKLLAQVSVCGCCGWWTVYRVHQGGLARAPEAEGFSASIGCLKELDLADVSTPLAEIRKFLMAKKDRVYEVHPKIMEDVVGSVFKDFGYQVRVTAYSRDDGIDVILDDSSGETIGVQVRRYKKDLPIEAEQIRSLAGALQLGAHTRGVFLTTSSFRKGAKTTARRYAAIGVPIELMDAERFFKALGIAQRQSLDFTDEQINFYILMSPGIHIGTGLTKEFEPGENLLDRKVLAQAFFEDEWIELERDRAGQ